MGQHGGRIYAGLLNPGPHTMMKGSMKQNTVEDTTCNPETVLLDVLFASLFKISNHDKKPSERGS